jgi:hypothetical protein
MNLSLKFTGIILIFSSIFIVSCKRDIPSSVLEYREGVNFENIKIEKVFELTDYRPIFWVIPFPERVVALIPEGMGKTFEFFVYDYSGRIIENWKVNGGDGPNELREIGPEEIISFNENEIIGIESRSGYIKSINLKTHEIKTIGKLSNIVRGYGSKYVIPRFSSTSIDRKGGSIVLGLVSTDFWDNGTHYFVKFDGIFRNFRVISKAEKEAIKILDRKTTEEIKRKKIISCDYYNALRTSIIFSVDWKREVVYYIPAIEEPFIEAISFDGKLRRKWKVDINFKKFKVKKEKIEEWCERAKSSPEPIFKILRQVTEIPHHAPPLQDIKVIEDRLLIITGNRNWDKEENETLVYHLPDMKYEGSFYLPFLHLRLHWFGNYYMTNGMIKKDDDWFGIRKLYSFEIK